MLYLVPTPIGNLEDITLRAIRILKEVDLILAEDTRTSGKLLKHYDIDTSMRSHHTHNEHQTIDQIINQLSAGTNIALISDAGSPGISDPGYLLVRAAVKANIKIIPLPGATAFVPVLTASGIPCDKFHFEGFLPHKKGRQTRIKYLATVPHTFVLYESPFRLIKCLKQLLEFCGDRPTAVGREISKIYEEIVTGSLSELIIEFEKRDKVKGEIVIVVGQ